MNDVVYEHFQAPVQYARVHEPVDKYKGDAREYKIDLLLDEAKHKEMLALFEKHNISVKVNNPSTKEYVDRIRPNTEGVLTLTIRRNEFNSKGNPAHIAVMDSRRVPIPPNVLIGNGSLCEVEIMITRNSESGEGVMRLSGVQVLNLVPFKAESRFSEKEDGFTVDGMDVEQMNEAAGDVM